MRSSASRIAFTSAAMAILASCSSPQIVPQPPTTNPVSAPPAGPAADPGAWSEVGLPGLPAGPTSVYDVQKSRPALDFFSANLSDICTIHVDRNSRFAVVTTGPGMVLAYVTGNPEVTTVEGVSVGDSLDDLNRIYGSNSLKNLGRYSKEGGDLVAMDRDPGPQDNEPMLVFESDANGAITEIRAGMWPWVGYVDYCTENYDRNQSVGWPVQ